MTGKIVVENGELHIYNSYGITNCLIVQMENKREMSAKELINGLKFEENSHVYQVKQLDYQQNNPIY